MLITLFWVLVLVFALVCFGVFTKRLVEANQTPPIDDPYPAEIAHLKTESKD